MPNRARSGAVRSPARVVAPINVKPLDRYLDRPCTGALADDDIELEVLHRWVEDLLDHRTHPVDLVDEEYFVLFEVGQNRGQVARLLEYGPGGRPDRHAELIGDDIRQSVLPRPGGP